MALAVMGQPVARQVLRGFKASGRSVLVAGTVTVTPAGGVAATDVVLLTGGINGGTEHARAVTELNAGAGTFTITSENNADTSTVVWALFSNLFLG